jgi:hypothetical protein
MKHSLGRAHMIEEHQFELSLWMELWRRGGETVLSVRRSGSRSLRRIFLPGVLHGSQNSNSQEDYRTDPDPLAGYVHHVRAPNKPTKHDHEPNGINPKRHWLSPLDNRSYYAASRVPSSSLRDNTVFH